MLNELSPWHIIIVLLVFAVLFGARRLPDAARGLGRSMRIFRAEMSSAASPDTAPPAEAAAQPPAAAVPTTAVPATAAPSTPEQAADQPFTAQPPAAAPLAAEQPAAPVAAQFTTQAPVEPPAP